MRIKIPCAVFFNYSPRGQSENARISRIALGKFKKGDPEITDKIAGYIHGIQQHEFLKEYLNDQTYLIPVPRNAPLLKKNALWPSKIICGRLVANGLGKQCLTIVNRISRVDKSSSIPIADNRPSVETHINSLEVSKTIDNPEKITVVDDVLTLGRTTYACVHNLKKTYPDCDIRIFVMMRTMGLVDDIDKLVNSREDFIYFNTSNQKTWIPDLDRK